MMELIGSNKLLSKKTEEKLNLFSVHEDVFIQVAVRTPHYAPP